MKAIAVFKRGSVIEFTQGNPNNGYVTVKGNIKGLPLGKHGLHIHEYGDLSGPGCLTAGGHYNPTGKLHGGLHDTESHAGDLGNVSNGPIHFKTKKFSISEILGRALIIHENEDDLGKGNHSDSLTTGHAGMRMECAVIGIRR